MGQVPKRIILPQRESRRLFVVKGGENSQIEDVFLVKSLPLGLLLRALFVHFGFRHPGLIQDVLNSQISSTKGLIEAVVRFSLSLRFSALPPPPPSQRSGRPLPPSLRGRGRGGSYLLPRSGRAGSPTFRPTFEKNPPRTRGFELELQVFGGVPSAGRFIPVPCADDLRVPPAGGAVGWVPTGSHPTSPEAFDVFRAAAKRVPLLN